MTLTTTSPTENEAAAATIECDAAVCEPSVELCTNCSAPRTDLSVAWCRKCGFHPRFGRCIELVGDDLDRPAADETEKKPSAADGIIQMVRLVPSWVWKASVCVLAAVAISLAGRYFTAAGSLPRLAFSISLLAVATLSILGAQFWAFFYAVTESDRLSVSDVLMRPFAVWSATIRDINLPGIWRRVGLMGFGLAAEILALAVVGGIPWHRIWELGPVEPPKQALRESVENIGRERPEPVDPLASPPPVMRRAIDCLVLGYIPYAGIVPRTGEGTIDFESLVVATEIKGRLVYVGLVAEGIPDEARQHIAARLPQLARDKPLIPCEVPAKWIDPALTCRVSYGQYSADNKMDKPLFEKLLAEIEPTGK